MSVVIPEETLKQWREEFEKTHSYPFHKDHIGLYVNEVARLLWAGFKSAKTSSYEREQSEGRIFRNMCILLAEKERDIEHIRSENKKEQTGSDNEAKRLQERVKELEEDLEIKERVHQEKLNDMDETFNHYRTKTKNEIAKRDQLIEQLENEADIGCQSLHEYRDNMASRCDDDWHDARGPLADGKYYTGRSAMVALEKMPKSVRRRHDKYLQQVEALKEGKR